MMRDLDLVKRSSEFYKDLKTGRKSLGCFREQQFSTEKN
jgi:hypothetical protein